MRYSLRLDLRIWCTPTTPARKYLGIWRALPIYVTYSTDWNHPNKASNEDNTIAALEHADRVCDVRFDVMGSEFEKISAVMRGGSAPRLRSFHLDGIPFPSLPMLL